MMFLLFIFYFLHLPVNKGASHTNGVFQTPPFIIKRTGQSVTSEIKCSHNITYYDRILWYKQDKLKALKLLGYLYLDTPYPEDDVKGKISFDGDGRKHSSLTVSDLTLDDSGVYFCAASYMGGDSYSEAYFGAGTKLTVLESGLEVTKPTVKVLKPSKKECRNSKDERKKKTLVCVASRFYPDHVSVNWEINGADVEDGVATDNAALRNGSYYKITSRLRVFVQDWNKKGKNFTCIVSFFNGKETITVADTILGVKVEGKNVTREKYMRITHTAKFSYGVFIAKSSIYGAFVAFLVWKLQGSGGKWNN